MSLYYDGTKAIALPTTLVKSDRPFKSLQYAIAHPCKGLIDHHVWPLIRASSSCACLSTVAASLSDTAVCLSVVSVKRLILSACVLVTDSCSRKSPLISAISERNSVSPRDAMVPDLRPPLHKSLSLHGAHLGNFANITEDRLHKMALVP